MQELVFFSRQNLIPLTKFTRTDSKTGKSITISCLLINMRFVANVC